MMIMAPSRSLIIGLAALVSFVWLGNGFVCPLLAARWRTVFPAQVAGTVLVVAAQLGHVSHGLPRDAEGCLVTLRDRLQRAILCCNPFPSAYMEGLNRGLFYDREHLFFFRGQSANY